MDNLQQNDQSPLLPTAAPISSLTAKEAKRRTEETSSEAASSVTVVTSGFSRSLFRVLLLVLVLAETSSMAVRGGATRKGSRGTAALENQEHRLRDVYHSPSRVLSLTSTSAEDSSSTEQSLYGLSSLLAVPASPVSVLLHGRHSSTPLRQRKSLRRSFRRSLRRASRTTDHACNIRGSSSSTNAHRSRVCQNCQKITKAPGAYDDCCEDAENAYNWCSRIYDFTSAMG